MKALATSVAVLLAAAVAQATPAPPQSQLPQSVQDFVDYVCDLEEEDVIPPPFPDSQAPQTASDVIFEQAFDAYVRAGLLDDIPQCDGCRPPGLR